MATLAYPATPLDARSNLSARSIKVAPNNRKRAQKPRTTDSDEERRAANRRAAFQARMRKKKQIAELQDLVKELSKQVLASKADCVALQFNLKSTQRENQYLALSLVGVSIGSMASSIR